MTDIERPTRAEMPDNDRMRSGEMLFEAFVEQVKQALEHLYDFAYLQQHPLARFYDRDGELSAKTAGRQLRHELIKAIESLKPPADIHFREPIARLYNILHMYYVESLNIQATADELGLSERQAYRDLRRGQESVAAVLWDNRLPPPAPPEDFSLESEVARLKLSFSPVDVGAVFRQAEHAVEKLAQQQGVEIDLDAPPDPMMLSTDAAFAHQILISLLSLAVQQARPGILCASFAVDHASVTLTLRYATDQDIDAVTSFAAVIKLADRLHWTLTVDNFPASNYRVALHMTSENVTILVIDDNEGWVELLGRFLEGYNCLIISASATQDVVDQAEELNPTLIVLDVMMPERDGWELLQRLRLRPSIAHIPIIVCTVFNDPQLAYSLGATRFISKPASREAILDALEQIAVI
ncbi:MAG: response regulator [Anaerolineae bacterium]|nr:response regulator [Anaerolineae bacterium]